MNDLKIVFLFYNGMTALDAIGPHEVLGRLPKVCVQRVAKYAGPIQTESSHLIINADYSLSEITSADVLLIPGAGNATTLENHPDILDWIYEIHASTTWTTSVCTGSLILGAAGLLSGLDATSHWAALDKLQQFGAIPLEKRIVESGKIITAAGVSAGIDMALYLASKLSGQTIAETIQLGIEYDPEPPFQSGSPKKARPEIVSALRSRLLEKFGR